VWAGCREEKTISVRKIRGDLKGKGRISLTKWKRAPEEKWKMGTQKL